MAEIIKNLQNLLKEANTEINYEQPVHVGSIRVSHVGKSLIYGCEGKLQSVMLDLHSRKNFMVTCLDGVPYSKIQVGDRVQVFIRMQRKDPFGFQDDLNRKFGFPEIYWLSAIQKEPFESYLGAKNMFTLNHMNEKTHLNFYERFINSKFRKLPPFTLIG